MFNVYPVEIRYTRLAKSGVLAGVPCNCTFGVESEEAGRRAFEELKKKNPDVEFDGFEIIKK